MFDYMGTPRWQWDISERGSSYRWIKGKRHRVYKLFSGTVPERSTLFFQKDSRSSGAARDGG